MAKAKCNKMNPRIKAMWLEALRSGRYKQGKEYLNNRGRFCCLGVLTDLYIQEKGNKWDDAYDILGEKEKGQVFCFKGKDKILPALVRNWAGIKEVSDVGDSYLANLNDQGTDFTEIADVIENNL